MDARKDRNGNNPAATRLPHVHWNVAPDDEAGRKVDSLCFFPVRRAVDRDRVVDDNFERRPLDERRSPFTNIKIDIRAQEVSQHVPVRWIRDVLRERSCRLRVPIGSRGTARSSADVPGLRRERVRREIIFWLLDDSSGFLDSSLMKT